MDRNALLRSLPNVSDLLARDDVAALLAAEPRPLVLDALRDAIEARRAAVLAGSDDPTTADDVVAHARLLLAASARPSLRRVVNATGIIVHTNLGRSPMALDAIAAAVEAASGYSTLEYDAVTGQRGSRHVHVEALLTRLTGAEAAMAVNNNAAAVLLALAGLAGGREAIVSRGQLVEIGGSFRIPDIMAQSGARMVEVGTTNKTHLADYADAITADTGVLLKVHSSNFRMVGFIEQVETAELAALGAERGVPVFEDQGSGVLLDLTPWGLSGEPTIGQAVAAGADVVSASGDKLLGGPQAGILVGRATVIERLKKHPLARALRLDKMTLAALEATLRLYLEPERALAEVPTLAMLTAPAEVVRQRAEALAARIRDAVGRDAVDGLEVSVEPEVSRAGGGALPMADIPTFVAAVASARVSANDMEARLRAWEPHIVARIKDGRVFLDPRTLSADDADIVVEAFAHVLRDA
jgi:L-seryl-tRNA(Ser) seleniumtransferase